MSPPPSNRDSMWRDWWEEAPLPCLLLDANDRIAWANRRFTELVGEDEEKLVGNPLDLWVKPEDSGGAARGADSDPSECLLRTTHGRELTVRRYSSTARQGTRLLMLSRTTGELSSQRLSSRVGHELANLLTPLLGYIELTRLDASAPTSLEALMGTFLNIARRMHVHVQNLLTLRERPAGSVHPRLVSDLVDRALEVVRETGLAKEHHLRVTPFDPALTLTAECEMVQQLIVNLVLNAAEAMRTPGTVDIDVRAAKGNIEFRIADTGPGIPEESRERIFEPFYSTKANGRGIGLGLFVARRIAERQGGEVVLEMPNRPGATFVARFPVL